MGSLRRKQPVVCLVETCKSLREIEQIHGHMLIKGLLNNPALLGQYVSAIALKHPNHINYSIQILDQCENPTLSSLNTLIRAHCKSSNPQKSFHFYQRILDSNQNLRPDHHTFNFLVRACAQLLLQETGFSVLGSVIKYGFDHDPHVQSSLVYMFAELGLVGCSRKVFMEMCEPDLVTQTAMLSACAKSGDLGCARDLFDKMPQRDSVAWNAMLAGYAQCGKSREALELFYAMQMEGVRVNEVSIVLVLSACTQLGALDQGRLAHSYVDRFNLRMCVTLGSALVDMYAKCGDVNKALEVFWGMTEKNVFTWTSAMGGLAMNGYGKKCLELFSMMKHEGVEPNEVTFVSVLKGCSVAGLVEEGQKHFESMKTVYGIEPSIEHYGCVVDLYARAGRLDEAFNFINSMPMKPHAGAWGALLHACKIYNNTELGELASTKIVELEGHNHGAYVQLSNIYADSKNWERVDDVRQTMRSRGITKVPGWSVVDGS